MSYEQFDPDGFESGQGGNGGGLRKALEQSLEDNKKLREQVEQFMSGQASAKREETATELLKNAGLDPALVGLIPDDADPAKWLEDKGHLLGVKKAEAQEQQPGSEPEVVAPAEEDPAVAAERQARERMQGAAEGGSTAIPQGDQLDRLGKIDTEEDLIKFFKENGMP